MAETVLPTSTADPGLDQAVIPFVPVSEAEKPKRKARLVWTEQLAVKLLKQCIANETYAAKSKSQAFTEVAADLLQLPEFTKYGITSTGAQRKFNDLISLYNAKKKAEKNNTLAGEEYQDPTHNQKLRNCVKTILN